MAVRVEVGHWHQPIDHCQATFRVLPVGLFDQLESLALRQRDLDGADLKSAHFGKGVMAWACVRTVWEVSECFKSQEDEALGSR